MRASKAGTPTSDVQVLSWSLQVGIAYDDLGPRQRALVDHLIPEYRAQLQLGFAEKVMRDWNTWSSRLPIPSFNQTLAKMGDVGTVIQTLLRARQDIINKNYNYHTLASVFVTQEDARAPIEKEKIPWSRLHDRIFMRFIAPYGAMSDGIIQIRILDGHSHHQQQPNIISVTEVRPDRGADGCALSESLVCNQQALATFERLAGPRVAQVALADFPGPDDLSPAIIAQPRKLPLERDDQSVHGPRHGYHGPAIGEGGAGFLVEQLFAGRLLRVVEHPFFVTDELVQPQADNHPAFQTPAGVVLQQPVLLDVSGIFCPGVADCPVPEGDTPLPPLISQFEADEFLVLLGDQARGNHGKHFIWSVAVLFIGDRKPLVQFGVIPPRSDDDPTADEVVLRLNLAIQAGRDGELVLEAAEVSLLPQ
jgi:hypothetical protein